MPRVLTAERPPGTLPSLRGTMIIPTPGQIVWDDDLMQSISAANPGWKFEVGCDGELVINMHSGGDSGDISAEFGRQIGNWRVGGGGGKRGRSRVVESGYWLGGDVRQRPLMQPDVSWVSPEQIAALSAEEMSGAYPLCPPFVVEIRSPTDELEHQQDKMLIWLHYGVRLGWLVDPQEEIVWIYRADQTTPQLLDRPPTLSGEDVLAGLEIDMSEVWALVDETKGKSATE